MITAKRVINSGGLMRRHKPDPVAWATVLLFLLLVVWVTPVFALECPAPQPLSRPGVLRETQTQTQYVADLLATGDDDNRIRVIVNDLRARYPSVENAELVNYLMAAYCEIVARLSGLGEQEKQARMDHFVTQLGL
jgi:hypothetical protein